MLPSPGGKCGRAPWGRQPPAPPRQAGSEREAPAPPAQPRAQRRPSGRATQPGTLGRPRQAHDPRSPGAALAPASLSFCFQRKGKSKKKRDDQTLEAGRWQSLKAERGRARARGGRWKLPPRRPGGGEEKEGFGGNEGDLKSRPARQLSTFPPPRAGPPSAAPCCPLPATAGETASAGRRQSCRTPALCSC